MKSNFITLIIALMLILSACEFPPPTETPEPDPAPAQAEPAPEVVEPEPKAPESGVEESESAETEDEPEAETTEPEEGEVPPLSEVEECVELIEPLDGIDLSGNARVTFSWSAHPEADSYSLNFIFPDGLELSFAIDETTTARYMSGFSMHPAYNQSGEHQWNITALNTAGEEICHSEFFTFTKPISVSAPESAPQGDGGGGQVPPT